MDTLPVALAVSSIKSRPQGRKDALPATLIHLTSIPLKMAFAQIKACLNTIAARTHDNPDETTEKAIDLVAEPQAQNYFRSCVYVK